MRYVRAAVLALTLAASRGAAQAPERESAVGRDLGGYGGFIGLDTRFGDMGGDFAVFMGGHAALLLKHRVYLGVAGAGLITESRIAANPPIDMAYGGILVGYVVPTTSLVQFTVDALIGAAGVKLTGTPEEEWDASFVFEPSAGAEIKLARIARLGFGVSYRFVGGVETGTLRDKDLRGFSGSATLRLGWF